MIPVTLEEAQMRHARGKKQRHHLIELILFIIITIVIAGLLGFLFKPAPFISEVGDVAAIPRSGCQMVCPGPTLGGVCPYKKIVWRPPYPCIPSTY